MCVCDRDQVIAVSGGSRKELLGKNISRQLETVLEDRENILVDNKEHKYIQITDNDREDFTGEAVSPIPVSYTHLVVYNNCMDTHGYIERTG